MITDEELQEKEAEVNALFGSDGSSPEVPPEPTEEGERRIEQILVRVRVEALLKETTSFVFNSFGATLSGVMRAMFGAVPGGLDTSSKDEDKPDSSS